MFNIKMGIALITTTILFGCDINQTEKGALPDLKAEGSNMPEFNIDIVEVKVKTKTVEEEVPDVKVVVPDEKNEI